MKKIIILLLATILLTACEYDNYDAPSVTFSGQLLYNDKPFLCDGNDDVHAHQRANRLQVVDEARHQVAGLVLVVIVRRERGQVREQIAAQFLLNRPRRPEQEKAPRKTPHRDNYANQHNLPDQPHHAAHIQRVLIQPVGNFACEPRHIGIHLVHNEQRQNAQNVLPQIGRAHV